MKRPNTLPELLRHAADLAEKGESLADKFECLYAGGEIWRLSSSTLPDLMNGRKWRIADQDECKAEDQHLLDDGWIRHIGDVCPVNPKTIVNVRAEGGSYRGFGMTAGDVIWVRISGYQVTSPYVEPTTFEMKVGDKVFVLNKPYMSAPEKHKRYYVIINDLQVISSPWCSFEYEFNTLKAYNCWRTEADAKAYSEAKLARDKFEIGEIK